MRWFLNQKDPCNKHVGNLSRLVTDINMTSKCGCTCRGKLSGVKIIMIAISRQGSTSADAHDGPEIVISRKNKWRVAI